MKMSEFISRVKLIRRLNEDSFNVPAWAESNRVMIENAWREEHENLKAECGADYNFIYNLAESVLNGNEDPDLGFPLYNFTGADLDRIFREMDVFRFTASSIAAGTIIELKNLGWQYGEFIQIKDNSGAEIPALVFSRS